MRPFRFFFMLSLGILLFFFIARFVIMALIAAAVLSFVFYIFRSIKFFFRNLTWEHPRHSRSYEDSYNNRYEDNCYHSPQLEAWKLDFFNRPNEGSAYYAQSYSPKYRVIEII